MSRATSSSTLAELPVDRAEDLILAPEFRQRVDLAAAQEGSKAIYRVFVILNGNGAFPFTVRISKEARASRIGCIAEKADSAC